MGRTALKDVIAATPYTRDAYQLDVKRGSLKG